MCNKPIKCYFVAYVNSVEQSAGGGVPQYFLLKPKKNRSHRNLLRRIVCHPEIPYNETLHAKQFMLWLIMSRFIYQASRAILIDAPARVWSSADFVGSRRIDKGYSFVVGKESDVSLSYWFRSFKDDVAGNTDSQIESCIGRTKYPGYDNTVDAADLDASDVVDTNIVLNANPTWMEQYPRRVRTLFMNSSKKLVEEYLKREIRQLRPLVTSLQKENTALQTKLASRVAEGPSTGPGSVAAKQQELFDLNDTFIEFKKATRTAKTSATRERNDTIKARDSEITELKDEISALETQVPSSSLPVHSSAPPILSLPSSFPCSMSRLGSDSQ